MDLVHHLTLLTLKYNVYIRVEHIADKKNEIADSLSRFQFQRFRSLAPHADPRPCPASTGTLEDLNTDIQSYLGLSNFHFY